MKQQRCTISIANRRNQPEKSFKYKRKSCSVVFHHHHNNWSKSSKFKTSVKKKLNALLSNTDTIHSTNVQDSLAQIYWIRTWPTLQSQTAKNIKVLVPLAKCSNLIVTLPKVLWVHRSSIDFYREKCDRYIHIRRNKNKLDLTTISLKRNKHYFVGKKIHLIIKSLKPLSKFKIANKRIP